MPEEATQVLAQFAAALTYEQLPDRVKEHCKNLLLDALACALAGHQGEETHQVAALASSLAQSSETSVIGGDHLSLAGATLFNGYLITAVTMCDAHRSTIPMSPRKWCRRLWRSPNVTICPAAISWWRSPPDAR